MTTTVQRYFKIVALFTTLFCLLLISATKTNAQWSELGGTGSLQAQFQTFFAQGGTVSSNVVSDASGNIYLGLTEFNQIKTYYQDGALKTDDYIDSSFMVEWVKSQNRWTQVGQTFVRNLTMHYTDSGAYKLGATTDPLSNELYSGIYNLAVDANNNVYATGLVNSYGYFYVAKWDGRSWSELGGTNTLAGSTTASNTFSTGWPGQNLPYGLANANSPIKCITIDPNGNVYVAGAFLNGNGYEYVAEYNGSSWSEVGGANTSTFNNVIYTMTTDPSGSLYIAGLMNYRSTGSLPGLVYGNFTSGYYYRIFSYNGTWQNIAYLQTKTGSGDGPLTNLVFYQQGFNKYISVISAAYNCTLLYNAYTPNQVSWVSSSSNSIYTTINANSGDIYSISVGGIYDYNYNNYSNAAVQSFTSTSDTTLESLSTDPSGNLYAYGYIYSTSGVPTQFFVEKYTPPPAPTITSFSPTTAGEGKTVTISGSSFTTVTGVSFGGVAASSFTIVNDNTITAIVGSGASGDVSITNATGSNSLPGFKFPPTITSFQPTTASAGTTITISGSGFTGATSVEFGDPVPATSFTVVNDNTITAVVPAGTSSNINGQISVTTPDGSSSVTGLTYIETNTWTGASTDWNTASNWSTGTVPTSIDNVVVPSSPSNQPILSGDATANAIEIDGTLKLNGHSLTLSGAAIGSGTIESSGSSELVFSSGSTDTLGKLVVENGNLTISGALYITNELDLNGGTLNTGDQLTLASSSTGTVIVPAVSGNITGKVNIQRYIPQGIKAYRDLGVAVSGGPTIAQAFNGGTTYSYTDTVWSSALSSSTALQPLKGYRTLVDASNASVTFSYSGTLLTGNQSPTLTGGQDEFSFIANPYQSQVNFSALTKSGIYDGYWYFNPNTPFTNGYENYNYFGDSTGGSNIYAAGIGQYLQPGQGFFVCSNTTGTPTLTFTESAKDNSNAQTTVFGVSAPLNRIATGLFRAGTNVDGAVAVFKNSFSDGIGNEDGPKINNHGENLTFLVAGKDLCANGWNMPKATDELPIHLYNLQTNTSYTLRLDASQFAGNGVLAYIKDNVLGTQTLLAGDSNVVAFATTTDTADFSHRYSIVFGAATLPVKEINITATELQNKQVSVKWGVVGESNIANYKVERSADGKTFNDLATVSPTSNNSYSYTDASPLGSAVSYYRIKATDNVGAIAYSNVAKLSTINGSMLAVFPNPVVDGTFKLSLANSGKYTVSLVDKLGRTVYTTSINHNNAAALESITLGSKLASGSYILKATDENGNASTTQIIVK